MEVAVVNFNRLLSESTRAQTKKRVFDQMVEQRERRVGTALRELRTAEEQSAPRHEVERKARVLRHLQEDTKAELDYAHGKMMEEITQEVSPVLDALAAARGAKIVLSVPNPYVPYVSDEADLTAELIARFDAP